MPSLVGPQYLSRKAFFYHQLCRLTGSGIGLIQAWEMQVESPPLASWRRPLGRALLALQAGSPFNEAIAQSPDLFPAFEAAILHAAQESGRLQETFLLLARHYDERAALARRLLALLFYPVGVFHLFVLLFPLSVLQGLVLQGNWVTFVGQKLLVLAPLYALIWFALYAASSGRAESWRATMEGILGWVPRLGAARRDLAVARLSAALEALISAGVPIIRSWELSAAASGSPAIRRAVSRMLPRLESGEAPSSLLPRLRVFPSLFVDHYLSGEVSGKLDESLRWLHRYYQEEGATKMKQTVVGGAGLVYFTVVALVAWQVLSFYIGYFRQIEEVIPK